MSVYPSWRYHKTKEAKIIHTAEQDEALGDEWAHSPADLQAIEVAPEVAVEAAPASPEKRKPGRPKKVEPKEGDKA